MTDIDISETISKLRELSGDNLESRLAIIRISEPIFSEVKLDSIQNGDNTPSKRGSDASAALDNPTPTSLETDLTHYKVRRSERESLFLWRVH